MNVVGPLVERYEAGDAAGAVDGFLALVGRDAWRATIERAVPGGVDQARRDAATFFEAELPRRRRLELLAQIAPARSPARSCPSWEQTVGRCSPKAARSSTRWFTGCVDADLPGVTHLLQMEATEPLQKPSGRFCDP